MMIAKIVDLITGRKQKKAEEERREREAETSRLMSEYYARENELWGQVLNTKTDRVASLDEFDDESIEAIYSILPYDVIGLWRENRNSSPYHQRLHASAPMSGDAKFYISCRYPNDDRGPYANIHFGYQREGFDVIKSRYDFVDALLRNRKTSPQTEEKRKALRAMMGKKSE